MQTSSFCIRNYRPEDFTYLDNILKYARTEFPLELQLARPGFSPEKDLFLVLNQRESICGYANITWEENIRRTISEIFVLPAKRCQGIGSELLSRAVARSRELGAVSAHAVVQAEHIAAGEFLCKRGFRKVRSYLDLEKNLTNYEPETAIRADYSFSAFKPGEEDKLAELQNTIFATSWGYCPNSAEEIAFYLRATDCRLEDIQLLIYLGKAAGYLWPQVKPDQGRIHMCGVLAEFRGKGIGRLLLLNALGNFSKADLQNVSLTVDEQNTAAVKLYTELGFVLRGCQFWWEKVLDAQG